MEDDAEQDDDPDEEVDDEDDRRPVLRSALLCYNPRNSVNCVERRVSLLEVNLESFLQQIGTTCVQSSYDSYNNALNENSNWDYIKVVLK